MPMTVDCKFDPRSGTIERSSSCSKKLLSVLDFGVQHHMLHARQAHWQPPVITRRFFADGHDEVTRSHYGRVDL